MKFGFLKKKEPKLTRREIAARRQAEIYDDIPAPQSYRRNRTLNSRQTASPMETSERLEAHRLIKKAAQSQPAFFRRGMRACSCVISAVSADD